MASRTAHADALHQSGEIEAALVLFREADQLQQEYQSYYPRLYSLGNFRYCEVLLARGSTVEVLERGEYALQIAKEENHLLSIALSQLTIGCANIQQRNLLQAAYWLNQAIIALHQAGMREHLPRGLLARAALHRHTRDFARAQQDLQEVLDIADGSGMRLHLTDYHLEMARLLEAEEKFEEAREQVAKAAKLITETGYKRRLPELEALQQQLA